MSISEGPPPGVALEIRVARTPEERLEIFRFRYRVYVQQEGRAGSSADHAARTLSDPHDDTAVILGAYAQEQLVGTSRVNFSSDGPLEHEELFGFSDFPASLWPHMAYVRMGIIDERYRGTNVFLGLATQLVEVACERGTVLIFMFTSVPKLYTRLGFRKYREGRKFLDLGFALPLVLDLRDRERLEQVRSPFLSIIDRYSSYREQWAAARR